MVEIEVNQGRQKRENQIEEKEIKKNMEEEEEVERKLRIREIEGMIVVELIEMEEKRKNRDVEKKMKE